MPDPGPNARRGRTLAPLAGRYPQWRSTADPPANRLQRIRRRRAMLALRGVIVVPKYGPGAAWERGGSGESSPFFKRLGRATSLSIWGPALPPLRFASRG